MLRSTKADYQPRPGREHRLAAASRAVAVSSLDMKAVACEHTKLEVVDLPTPEPAKGQVLVNV